MRRFSGLSFSLLVVLLVTLSFALAGMFIPAGIEQAQAAEEEYDWIDTGGEVADFAVQSMAWDGSGLYAGCLLYGASGFFQGRGVWRYDPGTAQWTDTGGVVSDYRFTALAWDGSVLYGGTGENGCWRYDPATPSWTDISPYLSGGPDLSFTSLAWDGSVLYAGTSGNGVWRYDPATGIWASTGGPAETSFVKSLVWGGSKLYIGPDADGVWCYDPAITAWTDTGGPATAYSGIFSLAWNGAYIYAGSFMSGVWRYDPVTGVWTDTGGDIFSNVVLSMVWDGSSIYAGTAMNGVWRYDPVTGVWTDTGGAISGNYVYSLAWDGSSRLYAGTMVLDGTGNPSGDGVWYCEVASDPPALTSVTPDQAMQFTIWQDVEIEGTGFKYGAMARLEKEGTPVTEAFNLNVASDTHITCTLGLFGLEPGAYDLVVENPDGQVAMLEGGFTITSPCGSGSATALLALGLTLGLLSAGSFGLRRRRRK